ncbi:hypothetical protein [Candidatus Uabimicrobium sp. HlEnr_7]|uniref:hypothetical protein n=1 Tax=Candidatus Uabimicrobium helgolandensis TaxID=3095367 RepID=UPI003558C400
MLCRTVFLSILLTFLCCCGSKRPFVFTNATQMADLYMQGELTDQNGNRWDIWIVPGMCPVLEFSKDSWVDAGRDLSEYGKKDLWKNCADWSSESLQFSGESFSEYLVGGITDDFSDASSNISANVSEAPFGWIPRIVVNAFWGYLIKPTFRLATAPIGIVGGAAGAVIFPVGIVMSPIALAAGKSVIGGTLIPLAGITAHQFVYLFAIPNREPAVEQDGRFGLYITNRKIDSAYEDEQGDQLVYEEEDLIDSSEEESEGVKRLDKSVLLKLASEYILLKKMLLLHNVWKKEQNLGEDEGLIVNIDSSLFYKIPFSEEVHDYYKNAFFSDFVDMWEKMQMELPELTREELISAKDAYDDFYEQVIDKIGFVGQ